MPSTFAITPADNKLRLNGQGRGEYSFTVTNTSGRPIAARARVTPQDPAHQSWYTIQDDPQRQYAADKGTEKINVQIAAPPSTPPGSYSFHLDVISVDNPDELFTIGPAVSFEVPKVEVKPKMKLWPILAAVAAVLVIGVTLWIIFGRGKKVPDLVGVPESELEAKLKGTGLTIGAKDRRRTGQHPVNTVISQNPEAGAAIPEKKVLVLVLEQEPPKPIPPRRPQLQLQLNNQRALPKETVTPR